MIPHSTGLEVRAATYVRMSTEKQNYSTDHQRAKLSEYAEKAGMRIVQEYVDEGKSGLDIKGRAGLQRLIRDVQSGQAAYSVIIVYDVSRWGRFQDVDEAAYHEYTCRRAGIDVEYCAEQFQNDGSPFASLLKSLKRTMAAEYSRELSVKVFSAQCRFIKMGFKQGGTAGYGLRRVAISDEGAHRRTLAFKERKDTATDRVVLVLGPSHEVEMVRRIYSLYLDEGFGDAAIARLLNAERVPSEFGRPWTRWLVATILTNRKYAGALVFNKQPKKLQSQRGARLAEALVVNNGAIQQLLAPDRFIEAQTERGRRATPRSEEELREMLRDCYKTHGMVSQRIIAADHTLPDPETFGRRFGSLMAAYRSAGIPMERNFRFIETKRVTELIRGSTFRRACELIPLAGGTVESDVSTSMLFINGTIRVRVDTTTSRDVDRESLYWKVLPRPGVDFILSARLDPENRTVLDYLLIPASELSNRPMYLRESRPERFHRLRYFTLEEIFGLKIRRFLGASA